MIVSYYMFFLFSWFLLFAILPCTRQIEEQILECFAWKDDSPLWDSIEHSEQSVPTCKEVGAPAKAAPYGTSFPFFKDFRVVFLFTKSVDIVSRCSFAVRLRPSRSLTRVMAAAHSPLPLLLTCRSKA